MSQARTARRRRKQFALGFKHVARLGRPIYRHKSTETQARALARAVATQRLIQSRKGQKA